MLMRAGFFPKPKRLRVGLALTAAYSWRLVWLEFSIVASFETMMHGWYCSVNGTIGIGAVCRGASDGDCADNRRMEATALAQNLDNDLRPHAIAAPAGAGGPLRHE
jgi:hypothetical protein